MFKKNDTNPAPQDSRWIKLGIIGAALALALSVTPLLSSTSTDALTSDGKFCVKAVSDESKFKGQAGWKDCGSGAEPVTEPTTPPVAAVQCRVAKNTFGGYRQANADKGYSTKPYDEYWTSPYTTPGLVFYTLDRDCKQQPATGISVTDDATGEKLTVEGSKGAYSAEGVIRDHSYTVKVDGKLLSDPESTKIVTGDAGWYSIIDAKFAAHSQIVLG
ncbi:MULTISPECIES: hypothetical protein [unclassified Curtobacterium]|uniref:hypothetical protein n=1 Tax=unclassified Curtobacterium TaxID=257496 RepID=UPI0037FD10F6